MFLRNFSIFFLGVQFFSMDDLPAWVPQPNGAAGDGNPRSPSAQPSNPNPSAIRAESWRRAEQASQEVIQCIQPTVVSDQRRRAVMEYVQNLIRWCLAIEVILLLIFFSNIVTYFDSRCLIMSFFLFYAVGFTVYEFFRSGHNIFYSRFISWVQLILCYYVGFDR